MAEGNPSGSLPPDYFDQVYAARSDPWDFTNSPYEREKYADTLTHLPRPQYDSGFEVGCSIGILTAQLAAHCRTLLSVDVSEAALAQARSRCQALPQVTVQRMRIPDEAPDGSFDLIVISEVAYYWTKPDRDRAMDLLAARHRVG